MHHIVRELKKEFCLKIEASPRRKFGVIGKNLLHVLPLQ
jgi:hypothetical protein